VYLHKDNVIYEYITTIDICTFQENLLMDNNDSYTQLPTVVLPTTGQSLVS